MYILIKVKVKMEQYFCKLLYESERINEMRNKRKQSLGTLNCVGLKGRKVVLLPQSSCDLLLGETVSMFWTTVLTVLSFHLLTNCSSYRR